MNPIGRAVAILGAVASIVAVGITSVSSAASSGLPTLTLTLNGRSVAVSGALQSGAVNVVSSVSVKHTEPVLIRLNPGSPFLGLCPGGCGNQRPPRRPELPRPVRLDRVRCQRRQGNHQRTDDPTARQLPGGRSEQQQSRPPAHHVRDQPSAAARLASQPGATISAIDFAFRGPSTLHDGELVRFQEQRLPRTPDPGDRRQERQNRQTAYRPPSRRQRQGGPEARDQLPGVRRTTFTRRCPTGADQRAAGHIRPRLHPAHPRRPRADPTRHGTHDPDRQVAPRPDVAWLRVPTATLELSTAFTPERVPGPRRSGTRCSPIARPPTLPPLARSLLTTRPEQKCAPVSSCLLDRTSRGTVARTGRTPASRRWGSHSESERSSPRLRPSI